MSRDTKYIGMDVHKEAIGTRVRDLALADTTLEIEVPVDAPETPY